MGVVILCGGRGERLWPASHAGRTKPFLSPAGDKTLLQQTLERAHRLTPHHPPAIIARAEDRFHIAQLLLETGIRADILLEPCSRNTAAAIAAAACWLEKQGRAADVMFALPSDHMIQDDEAWLASMRLAAEKAGEGCIALLGMTPDEPSPHYGYIECDDRGDVKRFVEKPDAATAEQFLRSGDFLWNSGMFIAHPHTLLAELQRHAPALHRQAQRAVAAATRDLDFVRLDAAAYAEMPDLPFDIAVMEKTRRAAVVPASCGWSDAGTWEALYRLLPKDAHHNATVGDVTIEDSHHCHIRATTRPVAVKGLRHVMIVDEPHALLVTERGGDLRALVKKMEACSLSTRTYRPWGYYECLNRGDRYLVKRLLVNPRQSLSLQLHHHRSEHWVVLRGTAQVTCGNEDFVLHAGQSAFVPTKAVHRLANAEDVPLELIEVQMGDLLSEEDILRLQEIHEEAA